MPSDDIDALVLAAAEGEIERGKIGDFNPFVLPDLSQGTRDAMPRKCLRCRRVFRTTDPKVGLCGGNKCSERTQ